MELLSVTSRDVPTAWLEEEKELTTLLKDPPSPEETVNGRRYRQSLNALHALVVLRLLELEKVKMAGTGASFSIELICMAEDIFCDRLQDAQAHR